MKSSIKQIKNPLSAEDVAIPHAIFDIEYNEACVNIGTSHDTS